MGPPEPSRAAKLARLSTGARADSPTRRFVTLVRDALLHLHDLPGLETHSLGHSIPPDQVARAHSRGGALRQSLTEAIESLRPPRDASPHSYNWRTYELLRERYVEGLPAVNVQARLGISESEYHSEHRAALDGVSVLLRRRWGVELEEVVAQDPSASGGLRVVTAAESEEDLGEEGNGPARHNPPSARTSFVGREAEMAEIRRLLGTTRLLTLTGAGGCGKTRLAVECARSLLDAYPDGVWLAQLAPIADPRLVPSTVANCLGVREAADEPITVTMIRPGRAEHCLLMIDNCEHLLDACAELADVLLSACPSLSILATSRQPLGIQGETNLRVPSLSSPPADEGLTREVLLQAVLAHDASRLFLDRARSAMPSFEPSVSNAPAIGEICRRLDGIPLAIELGAARVRGLGVEQLAARLDDRFHLLTGGSRTALRRQQTLRATIDWSYDLLSEPEKVLFRRLAVFAGGWTLEAAEAVCAGETAEGTIESAGVVDLLLQLVDRSLVVAEERSGEARYRLLETIRQYARQRLFESGETATVRDRHLEWYLVLYERAKEELYSRELGPWVARFEQEREDLRAALEWSLTSDRNASTAIHLAVALGSVLQLSGSWTDARERLGAVLARPSGDPLARVETLGIAASAESCAGGFRKAKVLREEALALARETGNTELIAYALAHLSLTSSDLGERDRARALQEEALGLAREVRDKWLIGFILNHLGMTAYLQGDDVAARSLAEEELAVYRDLGDPSGIAEAQLQLGYAVLAGGDLAHARALAEASLAQPRKARETSAFVCLVTLLGPKGTMSARRVVTGMPWRSARRWQDSSYGPRPTPSASWASGWRRAGLRRRLGCTVRSTVGWSRWVSRCPGIRPAATSKTRRPLVRPSVRKPSPEPGPRAGR